MFTAQPKKLIIMNILDILKNILTPTTDLVKRILLKFLKENMI